MLFDTDVLIWIHRGDHRAAALVDRAQDRYVSVQTVLELFQGAASKEHVRISRSFLIDFGFSVLPLTENIGHRATVYMEEYALSSGLRSGDSLIAATAVENNLPLSTGNRKHFRPIRELQLKVFKPS